MSQQNNIERRISEIKQELGMISEERWRAALSSNPDENINARIKAVEKTLENCQSLAKYVSIFSSPLARQISEREARARRAFDVVRKTRDPKMLHQWIKEELIPSTRFAERLGHIAASASKVSGNSATTDFHRWSFK